MELPEVEVLRRDLEKEAVGRRIESVEVKPQRNAMRIISGKHRTRKEFAKLLEGRKIIKVWRRGKQILVFLDEGKILVIHFKMSGRLLRATKRTPAEQHTHVVIRFAQGGELRYIDPRTLGRMYVAEAEDVGEIKDVAKLGLDPLENTFTWPQFSEMLAEKKTKLKQLLMDQSFIAGLGNIYSDEVLFAAGLRHDRNSEDLSSQEVRRLYRAIQETVQDAIRYRGTTLGDDAYLDLYGKPGEYQGELKVYKRRGMPCRRCRSEIQVVKLSGRGSYHCPVCQT